MKKNLLFLIIPACVYLVIIPLREASGHYYYALNSDPSYLYLFNGLNVAQCQPSVHVDNPGSTVQILGAVIIRATGFFRNAEDIQKDVILNPESYIIIINRVIFLLCLITLFLFGVTAYQFTNSLLWSILLQSVPFVSWQTMRIFLKVSPEMLIFISCILWSATLLRLSAKNDFKEHPKQYTFWFSFLTAISLATKLTMIPFVFIPLILFPMRISISYLLLSFIFFLLMVFPAWEHFDYLLDWIAKLFQHSSLYGSGMPNIIQFPESLFSFGRLIALEHTFYFGALAAIMLIVFIYIKKTLLPLRQSFDFRILQSLVAAVIIQLLMVSKHYNPHYLIPSLMLFTTIIYFTVQLYKEIRNMSPNSFEWLNRFSFKSGIILLLLYLLFLRHFAKNFQNHPPYEWLTGILLTNGSWLLIAIVIFILIVTIIHKVDSQKKMLNGFLNASIIGVVLMYCFRHADIEGFRQRVFAEAEDSRSIMDEVSEHYKDYIVILGERSSSPFYALKYGANENFSQPNYFIKMKQLYSVEAYFWDHSENFKTWTDEISLADILKRNQKVVLECDVRFTPPEKIAELEQSENVSLEKIYSGKSAELYRIYPK